MGCACLVVGLGSIGQRHAEVLAGLGHSVTTVSRRGGGDHVSLAEALDSRTFDYVVIATETVDHARQLDKLAESGFAGRVMVEKPLFCDPRPLPPNRFQRLVVGYNLRFHPLVGRLVDGLRGEQALAADFRVGQHLDTWRPGRDHRNSYSARPWQGGGVLRDLSHELDLAGWLFGQWTRVTGLGGCSGAAGTASEDHVHLLARFAACPTTAIHLNYLERPAHRHVTVLTTATTWHLDLVAGSLRQGDAAPETLTIERNATYRAMHEAMLADAPDPRLCQADEALQTQALIAAAERALHDQTWIDATP